MDYAINLKNVSKKFRLYTSPIDRLKESLHPFRKRFHHEHWALKDISFTVRRGETVGIMGRNGAGKSTLLQIITAVLGASEGEICVNGRISALLELGAGFNPEMTGRENVLAHAILMGISRREMGSKLPEIEKFANIGEYMDQPVKSYSSGMFVRLAFSMYISVEPDILIIDEALAVGDAAFQEKCFKKLSKLKESGKTFLLVSHSASLVSALCDRVIVLNNSKISFDGETRAGLLHYGKLLFGTSATNGDGIGRLSKTNRDEIKSITIDNSSLNIRQEIFDRFFSHNITDTNSCLQMYNKDETRTGDRKTAYICDYLIINDHNYAEYAVLDSELLEIYIKIAILGEVANPRISLSFHTPNGMLIYGTNSSLLGSQIEKFNAGDIKFFRFKIINRLHPGSYLMSLGLVNDHPVNSLKLDIRESLAILEVSGTPSFNGLIDLNSELSQVDINEKS